jgi:hypothetical protein
MQFLGPSRYQRLSDKFDEVFPRIARAAGDCQFGFIQYQKGARFYPVFRLRRQGNAARRPLCPKKGTLIGGFCT